MGLWVRRLPLDPMNHMELSLVYIYLPFCFFCFKQTKMIQKDTSIV